MSKFDYDSVNDQTTVTWATTLTNETIYNLNGFSVKFELYSGETLQDTKTYTYSRSVGHGQEYTGAFTFTYNGNIDNIKYVSWSGTYNTFWETYRIWIIVSIIVVAVLALIYLLCMIILDLEFGDVWLNFEDFFEEHSWILIVLLIPFGTVIYSFITDNWISSIIVGIATIALILLILIMHFIKFIVQNANPITRERTQKKFHKKNKKSKKDNNIEEYTTDKDDFSSYTVKELKEYCKGNNITNYSTLSKDELIKLIQSNPNENKSKPRKNKINKITFDDIAGLETAKQVFREKVVLAFEHKELYEKYGKKVGGGILLYGLPGTGKTMFAEAASNETDSLFIPIKCSDIKSKWYGESESNIKKIFDKARNAGKAIIFFDEFEAIGAKRTENSENGNNDLVPQILAEMQGVNKKSNAVIVVIAATNKPWAIDSAFLRPGRFDEKIYIPLPDMEARAKLCELKLSKVPTQDIDYNKMAELTDGFNGADITEFCEKLKMEAIRKSINSENEHVINMEDVISVAKTIKSSVLEEDIENLKEFEKKF
ncbi:MAG: AAA family ATPase [Clostridia bacterium]|nr:AAA family ATPase [Clostridia bacterium]